MYAACTVCSLDRALQTCIEVVDQILSSFCDRAVCNGHQMHYRFSLTYDWHELLFCFIGLIVRAKLKMYGRLINCAFGFPIPRDTFFIERDSES